MITRLTPEQGEKIKGIINNDANLIEAYLKIKDLDYEDWSMVYEMKHPSPKHWDRMYSVRRDIAWQEEVNKKLLPENVLGACVIGGLAISLIAKYPERNLLRELYNSNARGIQNVHLHEVSVLLEEEFGLTMNMQRELQYTNDNVVGKSEVYTLERRENLKKLIDSWTEPSEEAES